MKEQLSAHDQAIDVVHEVESKFMGELYDWKNDSEHRAETCGCPQCKGEAFRSDRALARELSRVYFEGEGDHEENWIAEKAFAISERNSHERT